MPTYYFEDTEDIAEAIVKGNKLEFVEDYVNENFEEPKFAEFIKKVHDVNNEDDGEEDNIERIGVSRPPWLLGLLDDSDGMRKIGKSDRMLFLVVSAIDYDNYSILEKIKQDIKLTERTDGNAYTPLEVAFQRLYASVVTGNEDNSKSAKSKAMIDYLINNAKNVTGEDVEDYLGECSRELLQSEDYHFEYKERCDCIDYFMQCGANAWELFYYSIALGYPEITEFLMVNHRDKINVVRWTTNAYKKALEFKSQESIDYVKNHPELKMYLTVDLEVS